MSCECQTYAICVLGRTYNATISYNARGGVQSASYIDNSLQRVELLPGSFTFGACQVGPFDVRRVIQPLVAGSNVVTHLLGSSPVEVEVRDNTTGAIISARAFAETADNVTIFVPVAVASARITLDA